MKHLLLKMFALYHPLKPGATQEKRLWEITEPPAGYLVTEDG
jgi:hypothetical protein